MKKFDRELECYIHNRIRELRDGTSIPYAEDPFIEAYTSRRIREIRLERDLCNSKLLLDNRRLGSYAVVTMGDHDD